MTSAPVPTPGSTFTAEDGTVSTVLPENYDPHYEPTQDELEEYANFIGIDPATEPQLMWIAKEGLRTPLPDEWRACQTDEDEVYYFNFKTGESLWDHPMDDTFKERVAEERAKLQSGGARSGTSGAATNKVVKTSVGKGRGAGGSAPTAGTAKAISDSLFAKPSLGVVGKTPPLPPPISRPGFSQALPARLGSAPDVSDILGLNASGSTSLHDNSGFPGAGIAMGGGLAGRPPNFASPTSPAPMSGAKDIEANIRRRVEEEYAPKRRQLSIDFDRKHIEEKHTLEEEVKKVKRDLDASWNLEKNKSSAQRTRDLQRELKEIEESWAKRLKVVGDQVAQERKELDARRAELSALRGESAPELKKRLDAQRTKELGAKRNLLEKAVEEEVARVKREQEESLAELRRREASALSTARGKVAEENETKLKSQEALSEKMLASLETEVNNLRATLAKTEEGANSVASDSTAPDAKLTGASQPAKVTVEDKQTVAEAQKEADDAVKRVASACAADLSKTRKELTAVQSGLQKDLDTLKLSTAKLAATAPAAASGSSVPPPLTPDEEQRLQREEERLENDVKAAARTFMQQTEALVLRHQRQRGTATPSSTSSCAVGNSPTGVLTSTSAWGAATSLAPVAARLQQLEAKHEECMRQQREESARAFKQHSLPNPRESSQYAKLFVEKQKAWNAENPAPNAEAILPKLEPVPKFTTTMGDMPEVPPPSEEEIKAAVAAKLTVARQEHSKKDETSLAELEKRKRAELDKLSTSYRDRRLAEVKEAIAKYDKELARKRSSCGNSVATASEANENVSRTTKAAQEKNAELRANIHTEETAIGEAESDHAKRMAELEVQIEAVEATIRQLSAAAAAAAPRGSGDQTPMASTAAEAPSVSEPTKVDVESLIITQPDYANYVSTEEANADEAALHAKWRVLLDGLRRSIRQQSVGAGAVSGTDTAPPAPGVPRPPAVTATPVTASAPPLSSYATPLQSRVAPLSSGDGYESCQTLFPHYQTPLNAPYSVNASTIRASPVVVRDSNASLSAGGPAAGSTSGVFLTPYTCTSLAMPSFNLRSDLATTPPPLRSSPQRQDHYVHCPPSPGPVYIDPQYTREGDDVACGLTTGTSVFPGNDPLTATDTFPASFTKKAAAGEEAVFIQRVARLHALLRQRRRELRERQQTLESLREDWRRDMRECRERGDRQQVALLKEVKATLEKEARTLNREVISLKEASGRLRQEELHTREGAQQQQQQQQHAATVAADDSTAILQTLLRVVERTERLEALLLSQVYPSRRQDAHPRTEEPVASQDVAQRKAASYREASPVTSAVPALKQRVAKSASRPPEPSAPSAADDTDRIGRWLQEQSK